MNPTLDQRVIDRALAEDRAAASAEYLADWRSDIEGVFTKEALDAAVIAGRRELPPRSGVAYTAFVDPSGGASDSMTLGIAHVEDGVAILDLLRERRPPFAPSDVVSDFAADIKRYCVSAAYGDRYGAEWVRESFVKAGIAYRHSEKSKSDLYGELIPLVNSMGVELLDSPRLLAQLESLERRTARGGRSSIDHPASLHDDLGNAACGALVLCRTEPVAEFSWTGVPLPGGKAARAEREAATLQPSGVLDQFGASIGPGDIFGRFV
jgi:hypothetical protein